MMNGLLLVMSAALPSFLLGYAWRRFTLKWQTKANTAKLEADIQAEQMAATVSCRRPTEGLDMVVVASLKCAAEGGCVVGARCGLLQTNQVAVLLLPWSHLPMECEWLADTTLLCAR